MRARLQDWPLRLDAYIEQRRCMAFAWGTHDCCQFARRDFEVLTGEDPAAEWDLRPYKTARGASAQLRRLGGVEALPAKAGCAEIAPLLAGRGDLALVPNAGRPALGVVLGTKVAFAGLHGLDFVPVTACAQAWRVG